MLNYCALVPAHNEEDRLASTLRALKSRREIAELIVIDDASTDATPEIARAEGADLVLRLEKNLGKGGALEAGIAAASRSIEAFLFLDADLGDSATEFLKLIAPLEREDADMTIGLLPPDPDLIEAGETGGGLGIVVGMARTGLLRRTGQAFEQPLAGQRAVCRAIIDSIGGKLPRGFGVEVGLTIAAMKAGFRVSEVETMFRHRVTGSDLRAMIHRARQLIDVVAVLRR